MFHDGKDYSFSNKDIVLAPNAQFLATFREKVFLHPDYDLFFELRSSRGRMLLEPLEYFFHRESGNIFFRGINRNINEIVLPKHSKFGQILIHSPKETDYTGSLITNKKQLKSVFPNLKNKWVNKNGELLFGVNKVFEINKLNDLLLAGKIYEDLLSQKEFEQKEVMLDLNKSYLLELSPRVDTADNLAIMLHRFNTQNTHKMIFSGWIDPGYKGKISGHFYGSKSKLITQNTPLIKGSVFKFKDGAIENLYGSKNLNNHYADANQIISRS